MRIRKNANVSSYMNSHASGPDSFQTHVCQLNQSPWDVIPFSQHQTTYPFHQFEDEDSFNGNGSLVDSVGAVESVASMMEDIDEKSAATIINNVDENYANETHNKKRLLEEYEEMKAETKSNKKSQETKSWHFKNNSNIDGANSSKKPHREAGVTTSTASAKKQEKISSSQRGRGKICGGKKGSGSAAGNPYEFYYYSGFGPSWGKRRGSDKVGELGNNSRQFLDDDILALDDDVSASPPRIEPKNSNANNNGFDYVEEEEDEEEEEEGEEDEISGKKRMRKPVKARSLKSLM